ncbi:hypothetical protein H8E07_11550 [bacterium]|nr:hypothetical protein [bacterium]
MAWGTEAYNLEAGESVQFHVAFADIPLRAWILSVEGDQRLCDVNVLRLGQEHLLYQQHDESRHRVRIPWGTGESVAVTVTADMSAGGVFTIKLLGPPDDTAERAYGYGINRALESLEADDDQRAESLLRDAIRTDADEVGLAALLLAGLLKDRGDLEPAIAALDLALRHELPEGFERVEQDLRTHLAVAQRRASPELREADRLLAGDDPEALIAHCESWLARLGDDPSLAWERCEALRRMGRAHQMRGRQVRAMESLNYALREAAEPGQKALVYHRLGLLLLDLDNADQARRALAAARELGLPPDLDASTETLLNTFDEE